MNQSIKSKFAKNPMEEYVWNHSIKFHPILEDLISATMKHESAYLFGDPVCLQLMSNLMKCINAKNVLDIGVFTGCSSLNAALSIPVDGKVYALDISADFAEYGKPFWEKSGVGDKIDLLIAPALETLDKLIADGKCGMFDFAFIDADKENYCNYFERCLTLIKSGGIICLDNVLWSGKVADPNNCENSTTAIRKANEFIYHNDNVNISMLNIGDGITIAFRK